MPTVEIEKRGAHAVVWLDHPPVNALSEDLRRELMAALEVLTADDTLEGAVIAGRGRAFIAGADISEFGKPLAPPGLPEVCRALEGSPKPLVAAIQGHALGGGLEVALACHYRVAGPRASLGLPEVTLGILPGAGGTQRLPRLVGLEAALRMMTSGRPVGATEAKSLGLVDEVTDAAVVEAGLALLGARSDALDDRRLSRRRLTADAEAHETLARWRDAVAKSAPGVLAPARIVDAVEAALGESYDAGEARERALFTELMASDQSAALRHLFFAERLSAKVPGLAAEPRPVGHVGVVGGGTMGSGIAVAALNAGLPVTVVERPEALDATRGRIRGALEAGVKRGKLRPEDMDAHLARLTLATDAAALAKADLAIEAVFEDLEVKRAVLTALDAALPAGAVIASNTSYLDLDALAAMTGRPEDVVGLHFFSPAHVMKLLEVVRGAKTAPDVLATALAFAKSLRKIAVVAGVGPGFIGNRLYRPYQREAGRVLLEGATPSQVDGALTGWGMKMGPLAVSDLSGLDIGYMARRAAPDGTVDRDAFRVHDRLVEAGDKGRKTGAGFYRYEGGRPAGDNPRVVGFLAEARRAVGAEARAVEDAEIVERCIYALVNEGALTLAEGVAQRASDIDVVYVNGYGFPRHRGGPMHYAERVGLADVLARVRAFGWTPAPLLVEAAASGRWPR
ncbi:MAG: 3-hydroxyacyl-CoA dehydrogenase NAD-binding domain-containing protein [Sandaracinaceae bacterium]